MVWGSQVAIGQCPRQNIALCGHKYGNKAVSESHYTSRSICFVKPLRSGIFKVSGEVANFFGENLPEHPYSGPTFDDEVLFLRLSYLTCQAQVTHKIRNEQWYIQNTYCIYWVPSTGAIPKQEVWKPTLGSDTIYRAHPTSPPL